MRAVVKIILSFLSAGLVLFAAVFVFFFFIYKEPVYIADHAAPIADVTIQPSDAIAIATPCLAGHGTVQYRKDIPLTLHVLKHGDWYYIMKTNYPAKTIRYYLQPAVKVHVQTGRVEFSKR
ncbi:MAG TPA: hypothetical protein PKX40_10555 [Spirochaetota bacterium]|nr:hypothetical protein [Spirochaetota bacterium]